MLIKISIEKYQELLKAKAKLTMLEDSGVKHWVHYDEALYPMDERKTLDDIEAEIDAKVKKDAKMQQSINLRRRSMDNKTQKIKPARTLLQVRRNGRWARVYLHKGKTYVKEKGNFIEVTVGKK